MNELTEQASLFLSRLDPQWAALVEQVGPCLHAPHPEREPYQALVRAVAYQQLHARAAEAIMGRMLALFPGTAFPTPEQLLGVPPETLRACGFSGTKLATIQGVAQARLEGLVPSYEAALSMTDEELVERLVTLKGIGRWTVEMMLIYTLARMDILPADDLGVREGYRRLKQQEAPVTRKQITEAGAAWSPYRTIAAWYLWRVPQR